ncbi:MAG: NUDIX hydrolase [Candidatus Nomurabacteria bacterium]|jgi:8-oxo-dGTP pyrophosphatase MutT (NUDIX family)|nr:NUDIX hydrolase [Candidatus Nomurabacteria bacterium]
MTPTFKDSFTYNNKLILLDWFDLVGKKLPDVEWEQVYIIGDIGGKVPLVVHESGAINLPGGHTEPGETVEQTLRREIVEELNMKVTDWKLLGYQHLTEPDGKEVNQLRVYAKLAKIGDFKNDPGGTVTGHILIDLKNLNDFIHYGKTGGQLIKLAAPLFEKGAK